MDVGSLLSQLAVSIGGGIVGGSLTILANRINARREQIKVAQEWYERVYLLEGIEPLTTYYTNLDRIFRSRSYEEYQPESLPENKTFPDTAFNRLQELLPDKKLIKIQAYIDEKLAYLRRSTPNGMLERSSFIPEWGIHVFSTQESDLWTIVRELRDGLISLETDLRKQIQTKVNSTSTHLNMSSASQMLDEIMNKHHIKLFSE